MDAKITLPESDLPRSWYNIARRHAEPPQPPLHPGTGQPVGPGRPGAALPDGPDPPGGLDRSRDPDPRGGARRPAALAADAALPRPPARAGDRHRARASTTSTRASRRPARTSRTRPSPRRSTSAKAGRKRLATETGAGPVGQRRSRSPAQVFGLECKVYMVRVSYDQKPYRRMMMETWGAERRPQPVAGHERGPHDPGRADADSPGSLGIAISEAVEDAARRDDTSYSLGSVLNHVLLHQTVIGQEAQRQLELAGENGVDVVIGCVGGGVELRRPRAAVRARQDRRRRDRDRRLRARGLPDADPRPVRLRLRRHRPADAAGADAHARPRLRPARRSTPAACATTAPRRSCRSSLLDGLIRAEAFGQTEVFEAAIDVRPRARRSSRRPRAPTPSRARSTPPAAPTRPAPQQAILFNLSGHGHFDMARLRRVPARATRGLRAAGGRDRAGAAAIESLPKPAGVTA